MVMTMVCQRCFQRYGLVNIYVRAVSRMGGKVGFRVAHVLRLRKGITRSCPIYKALQIILQMPWQLREAAILMVKSERYH